MFNMNQTIDQQPSNHMSSYHHGTPTMYHHHPTTHFPDYYHHTATTLDVNTLLEPNGSPTIPPNTNPSPILQQTSMTSRMHQIQYTSTLQQSLTQQQYQNYYDTQQLNSNDSILNCNGSIRYHDLSPASDKNGCMMSEGGASPPTHCDWSGYSTIASSPSSSSNLSSAGSINNVNNNSSYHVPNLYCNQQNVSPVSTTTATVSQPQQQQHHQHQQQQQQQQQKQVHHHNIPPQTASSSSREQRNRAEKMRRDKINQLINELGKLVPLVLNSPKRVHKTSVLRLTSTWLRIQLLKISYKKKLTDNQKQPTETTTTTTTITTNNTDQQNSIISSPSNHNTQDDSTELGIMENSFLVNSMVQMVCEQLGGFLMVLSTSGKIVLVSHNVEKLLERDAFDLMGQSIYDITHKEDHYRLRHQLSHSSNQMEDANGGEMRRNFNLRIARSKPRATEPISYVPVSISGVLIPDECLMCIVRVWKPTPLNEQLVEAGKDEYITRHLVDGRIITCDQRISVVAGYMTEEVAGLSAFNFMHREDVRWTMIALRQMYDRGESRGSSCYRLMTRTGDFIYLRTCGYLEVDSNGVVESFVCVNTLVTAVEGEQLIREMKERYSALIKPSNPLSLTTCESTATVEDPQKLQVAIEYLMHELPKFTGSPETKDCNNSDSSPPTPKRSRTESPIISSSMPLQETTIISHLQYTNSVHQQATISLDRQLRKQATTNHHPNNNNKQYSRSNDKLMNKYNLSKK